MSTIHISRADLKNTLINVAHRCKLIHNLKFLSDYEKVEAIMDMLEREIKNVECVCKVE